MKVNYVKLKDGNPDNVLTIINIEDRIQVSVQNFGSGEGRLRIAEAMTGEYFPWIHEIYGDHVKDDGWIPLTVFGHALVWASEITFAHVVANFVDNQ